MTTPAGPYRVDLDGNAGPLVSAMEAAKTAAIGAAVAASRAKAEVADLADTARRAVPDVRQLGAALRSIGNARLRISLSTPSTSEMTRLRALRADLAALNGQTVTINVEITGAVEALRDIAAVRRALDGLNDTTVRLNSRGGGGSGGSGGGGIFGRDGFLGDMAGAGIRAAGTTVKLLGLGVAIGTVGIAAGGAVAGVVAFVGALAPIGGIVAVLPAALATGAAAMAAFKVGVSGLDDAFKAFGDSKKFAEALEGLAPAARAFAVETRALVNGPLKDLQQATQQAMFTGLTADLRALTTGLLPSARRLLPQIASELRGIASAGVSGFLDNRGATAFNTTLTATRNILAGFAPTIAAATGALSTLLQGGAGPVTAMFGRLGDSLQRFFEGIVGRGPAAITSTINTARAALADLGGILGNLGAGLANVFRAGSTSSGGLLQNLRDITGEFRQFTGSATGQSALTEFFSGIGDAVRAVMPLLGGVVQVLAALTPLLGDLAKAAAPSIGIALNGLAQALAALRPAITPLGTAFGSLFTALAPVLPLLGRTAATLGGALAQALELIAPHLPVIVDGILGLVTAVTPLIPVIASLAGTMAGGFAQILVALTPLVRSLATALSTGFGPVIPVLSKVFTDLAAALEPVSYQIGNALSSAISEITPLLPLLAQSFGDLLIGVVPLIPAFLDIALALIPLLPPLVELATLVLPMVTTAMLTVVPPISRVIAKVLELAAKFTPLFVVIRNLPTNAQKFEEFRARVTRFLQPVITIVGRVGSTVGSMARGIGGLLDSAANKFYSFTNTVKNFLQPVIDAIQAILDKAGQIAGAIGEAIDRIPSMPNLPDLNPFNLRAAPTGRVGYGTFNNLSGSTAGRASMAASGQGAPAGVTIIIQAEYVDDTAAEKLAARLTPMIAANTNQAAGRNGQPGRMVFS